MNKQRFVPARPKTGQNEYYEALRNKEIVFVSGDAGVGKTYLALNEGLRCLLERDNPIDKICIIRPYIMSKTGERIGALPGTLDEKLAPFIASILDNLEELLPSTQEVLRIFHHHIECLTLSTLRGRSLHRRFIIVEEAQNVPISGDGMLTILTRMGKQSKLVIAGDLAQCDLDYDDSGFLEAVNAISHLEEVAYVEMEGAPTHRNPLIGKIVAAFKQFRNQG
jgi:phosphate starvation-inducible PhoH-like protein